MSHARSTRWGITTLAASAVLVGCTGSITVGNNTPELSADQLEATVSQKLAATTGQPEPDITCPDGLVGEVGTSLRCMLTADDGSTLGVTVTVTSVKDGKIGFDIAADQKGTPPPN